MATFEEAKRCPKCDELGEDTGSRRGSKGSRIHTVFCRNSACRWYNTSWVVQRMPDGTVPEREYSPHEKTFPAIPGMTRERAQREVEAIIDDNTTK